MMLMTPLTKNLFIKCSGQHILGQQMQQGGRQRRLTETRHVGMSNEVTSVEIYASLKHY